MTTRLYYTDAYATVFDAQLLEHTTYDGLPAVVLDRSYFYPTSGGQPHDTGNLNDVPVVEAVIRESDGVILHVLKGELAAQRVSGEIDWARRFDHMQHHTGQHILSQAFVLLAGAETVGFHVSPDSVTIDLDQPAVKSATVDAVEDLANQIVTDNRPVRVWFPSEDELTRLQLRKVPEVDSKLRVVEIEEFDVNACGGTHVAHTGEIGLIKILRVERRGDITRVEFLCGGRALQDYHQKHALLSQLAAELTTGYTEVPAALQKLREDNKTLQRGLRTLRAALLEQEAERLWQAGDRTGPYVLVELAFEGRDVADVRQLVQGLIAHPATIALCGVAGEKAQLIMARSDDLPHDMVPVLMHGLAVWDVDLGGGRPSFAQGGGATASIEQVQAALAAAVQAVRSVDR
ncbi:MAG TPA: alanyl-tRNA editing protein [Aggregatilineaceae bacterium]|nr:alanyl-tRNA editing protein [Aggregatilineaceae bacterium]